MAEHHTQPEHRHVCRPTAPLRPDLLGRRAASSMLCPLCGNPTARAQVDPQEEKHKKISREGGMRIAVASGKGGTGKTTVATNLARVAAASGHSVGYLDCDVEEPNGAIFLKPDLDQIDPVLVSVPEVDSSRCMGCGKCGEICQYSAIVALGRSPLVFPELCHGCGGCWLVCPPGAIAETKRPTGLLESGWADGIRFFQGRLMIGEAMSPPVIRAVKQAAPDVEFLVIDAPPGTSCPVIESVRDADFVVLVTEPTPFGLHDLKLAVEMIRALESPFAVIVNRAGMGDDKTVRYCQREGIEILAEIPDDRRIAEAYSRGELACDADPEFYEIFVTALSRIADVARKAQEGRTVA